MKNLYGFGMPLLKILICHFAVKFYANVIFSLIMELNIETSINVTAVKLYLIIISAAVLYCYKTKIQKSYIYFAGIISAII